MNQLVRPTVTVTRHQQAMPMHRRNRVERIFDCHFDFIAAAHANDRSKDWRRVTIGSRRLPMNERMPTGHDPQFDRVPLLSCIYERGDRQKGAKWRRIADAMPRPDEGTRCECSAADGKVASCQSHGLSAIGCTITDQCREVSRRIDWPAALSSLEHICCCTVSRARAASRD